MELQRFYTGYISTAIPPHRYPQVYNLRIGGKRRRRRSSAAETSKNGPYSRQTGKPSTSSPLAQVHAVSFLDLNFGAEDESDTEKESKAAVTDSDAEYDYVPLQNPWPQTSEKEPKTSYDKSSISLAHQTEPRGQVYLPFQSCSDLSTTLAEPDPLTPPGLGETTTTILQLCNELEYIANVLLPKTTSKTKTNPTTNSLKSRPLDPTVTDVLAESIIEVSLPKPGSLFDGDPFSVLPPADTVTV